MIDVVTLRHYLADLTGDIVPSQAGLRLSGGPNESASGTATYTTISPARMSVWKSAELLGRWDEITNSVRVRFSNGVTQYYLDDTDMKFKEVTDTSDWTSEWTLPNLMKNLDLWTQESLEFVVYMERTSTDEPLVKEIKVLLDLPTWVGAVHQAVKEVIAFVGTIQPLLIHEETLSADRSEWKIGEPYTEHGYDVKSLQQVAVNKVHKSAAFNAGIVTLQGPAAKKGDQVEIAVRYLPSVAVRRVEEVAVLHKTPAWWVQDLVVAGGLNGISTVRMVQGYEVQERKSELRMTVNGIAHRQHDALQMRLALQEAFGDGLAIELDSGRCITAQLDGLVEVTPQSGTILPMATAVVQLSLSEFVYAKLAVNPRGEDEMPQYTSVSIDLPDGVTAVADIESVNC